MNKNALLTCLASILLCAMPSHAATLTVTSLADDGGAGELRAAISAANASSGSTIDFQSGLSGTITLASKLPALAAATTIQGPTSDVIAIDGGSKLRVFNIIAPGQSVTIANVTIQNGSDRVDNGGGGGIMVAGGTLTLTDCSFAGDAGQYGGDIYCGSGATLNMTGCTTSGGSAVWGGGVANYGVANLSGDVLAGCAASLGGCGVYNSGTLAVVDSTIANSGNSPLAGGGVYNTGTATLTRCTIDGNRAADGAGIYNNAGITNDDNTVSPGLTMTNCTVTRNTASTSGGGVQTLIDATLTNCTISGNTAAVAGAVEVGGTLTLTNDILYSDSGGEIGSNAATITATYCDIQGGYPGTGNIEVDPSLGALASNGGPTQTMALGSASACYGAGTATGAPATDQRGVVRLSPPSIGAYDRTYPAGLAMFSVPEDYSGDTVASVLGYASPVLALWDPTSSSYDVSPSPSLTSLHQGPGYWVRLPQDLSITEVGIATPTTAPFTIQLFTGWNMIGDPFAVDEPLTGLSVTPTGSASETFAAAQSSGIVGPTVWAFSGGAYVAADTLSPYKGYWIYVSEDCTLSVPVLSLTSS